MTGCITNDIKNAPAANPIFQTFFISDLQSAFKHFLKKKNIIGIYQKNSYRELELELLTRSLGLE